MKIALVHDDFNQEGGAENLFAKIASFYPDAPIYTSLVDYKKLPSSIDPKRIRASFIQKIPLSTKLYKILLPLYPLALESFDFKKYDLVISSTTRFAKAVITPPKTLHICYINSIPRFLWNPNVKKDYLKSPVFKIFAPFFNWLKRWDKVSSSHPDFYIANSQNVSQKVDRTYQKSSEVIYPFADTIFFVPTKIHNWPLKNQSYFLVVTRLVKWKKVELAIKACESLDKELIIVGDGPDKTRLQKISRTATFEGRVDKKRLRELYQNAEALIVTQEEDFGIATVEAQACGIPVIAYKKGGQAEIIKDGQTGLFFETQTVKDLKDAILAFFNVKWSLSACRKNALFFSGPKFEKQFKSLVSKYVSQRS